MNVFYFITIKDNPFSNPLLIRNNPQTPARHAKVEMPCCPPTQWHLVTGLWRWARPLPCGEEGAATIKPNPIESMTDNDAKAEQRDVESRWGSGSCNVRAHAHDHNVKLESNSFKEISCFRSFLPLIQGYLPPDSQTIEDILCACFPRGPIADREGGSACSGRMRNQIR